MDVASARVKLRRAGAHHLELGRILQELQERQTMEIVAYADPKIMAAGWLLEVHDGPLDAVADTAADMVNNLRSALNYLAWQIYLAGGGDPENRKVAGYVQFPVVTDPERWGRTVARQLPHAWPAAVELVRAVQPFARVDLRSQSLAVLATLSNVDKHQDLHVCGQVGGTYQSTVPALPDGLTWYLRFDPWVRALKAGSVHHLVSTVICRADDETQTATLRRPDVQVDHPAPPTVKLGLIGPEGQQVPISELSTLGSEVERIIDQVADLEAPRLE